MTTLRERFRYYWGAEDYPETPEWFDPPRWVRPVGAIIVGLVGMVAVTPYALVAAVVLPSLPAWATAIASLVSVPAAVWTATHVGAPIADHLLGIPRREA